MEHSEQVRLLRILMEQLDTDTNADAGCMRRNPASAYTCSDLAEREWSAFFRGHPQLVGLSGDLPGAGSFLTRDDWGVPILATRDKEGRFHAFLNACRHRGARVESEERGERARFSCPFHAWTYANTGDLVSIPKAHHVGAIDKRCRGLVPLPAEEHYGFLWVHPDPQGEIDPAQLLGGLAPDFDSWKFGGFEYVGSDRYEAPINWKLALDTFGETYHFPVLHRNTLAQSFYGHVLAYDTFERNHRMILCKRGIDELRGLPESAWDIRKGGFPVYFLFPNVVLNVGERSVVAVRVYPDRENPGRSVSHLSFYFDSTALAGGEDDRENVREYFEAFASVVREEDYAAAAMTQKTAETGLQESFLFGRNEPPLHHYHNTFRKALGMPPLDTVEPG